MKTKTDSELARRDFIKLAGAFGAGLIQLHCIGPWMINYLNSADDPRQKK